MSTTSHSSPRLLRKWHRKARAPTYGTYGASGGNESLECLDDFVDIGSLPVSEISTVSPPSTAETLVYDESIFPSPSKSSRRVRRWLSRRKKVATDRVMPSSASNMPSAGSADLEFDQTTLRSRSVPNLKIDPPQLTLEQLAKIDAFYAPTPVLPEMPAPRSDKVYPPWSPDIDYKFNPSPRKSSGLFIARTADVERGYSRDECLKRFKTLGNVPVTSTPTAFPLTPPPSSRSEIVFRSQKRELTPGPSSTRETDKNIERRQTWIYSQRQDEMYSNFDGDSVKVVKALDNTQVPDGSKTPTNLFSQVDSLYFTMSESPTSDDGKVTLRFIEDPFGLSVPASEPDVQPSSPLSPIVPQT